MKIAITTVSTECRSDLYPDKNYIFVEGELGQVLQDLRDKKIDVSEIIDKNMSWINEGANPENFILDFSKNYIKDADVIITVYDYYIE